MAEKQRNSASCFSVNMPGLEKEKEGYIAGQKAMLGRLREDVYTHIATGDPMPDVSIARFQCLMQCIPPEDRTWRTSNRSKDSDNICVANILSLLNLGSSVLLSINRPSERMVEGKCPVQRCKRSIRGLSFHAQRKHIHRCRRIEVEKSFGTKAMYCYFCFKWIKMSTWSAHSEWHLESYSLDCGSLVHCGLVLQPALCPFCLGDRTLSPEARWHFWSGSASVLAHITCTHLSHDATWPMDCPHPKCSAAIQNQELCYIHLGEIHGLEGLDNDQGGIKLSNSDENGDRTSTLEFSAINSEAKNSSNNNHGNPPKHHLDPSISRKVHQTMNSIKAVESALPGSPNFQQDQPSMRADEDRDETLQGRNLFNKTAEKEWKERGYPQIRWNRLSNRIEELDSWLRTCLELQEVPIFRDRYKRETQSNSGISSCIKEESQQNSTVGYYGPRGQNEIFSALLNILSEPMIATSTADELVCKDPTAYIMQVLVPAVAHKLISEDMNQGSEKALQTLEEGKDLGIALYPI